VIFFRGKEEVSKQTNDCRKCDKSEEEEKTIEVEVNTKQRNGYYKKSVI